MSSDYRTGDPGAEAGAPGDARGAAALDCGDPSPLAGIRVNVARKPLEHSRPGCDGPQASSPVAGRCNRRCFSRNGRDARWPTQARTPVLRKRIPARSRKPGNLPDHGVTLETGIETGDYEDFEDYQWVTNKFSVIRWVWTSRPPTHSKST